MADPQSAAFTNLATTTILHGSRIFSRAIPPPFVPTFVCWGCSDSLDFTLLNYRVPAGGFEPPTFAFISCSLTYLKPPLQYNPLQMKYFLLDHYEWELILNTYYRFRTRQLELNNTHYHTKYKNNQCHHFYNLV